MSIRKKEDSDYWKQKLTSDEFKVCRLGHTEKAFSGKFNEHYECGVYVCTCCQAQLFSSSDKYNSGSGWPSYLKPISIDKIDLFEDHSYGMKRVEIKCSNCGSHLGHLFNDGPEPFRTRYCINSLSLKFINDNNLLNKKI